mgnify:CR=1 FL=1
MACRRGTPPDLLTSTRTRCFLTWRVFNFSRATWLFDVPRRTTPDFTNVSTARGNDYLPSLFLSLSRLARNRSFHLSNLSRSRRRKASNRVIIGARFCKQFCISDREDLRFSVSRSSSQFGGGIEENLWKFQSCIDTVSLVYYLNGFDRASVRENKLFANFFASRSDTRSFSTK